MINNDSTVDNPLMKFLSLWTLVGISSWTDFAAFLASIYSCILISEWIYKKFFKRT